MSGRPAVCKFYKQGHCSYGNNCRFYHPPQSGFGNSNGNYRNNNNNNNNNNSSGYNNYNNRGNNNSNYSTGYSNNNYSGSSNTNNNNSNNSNNSSNPPANETPQQFCDPRSMGRRETEIRNDMNELQEMLSTSNHIFTSYSLKPPVQINILPQRDFSYEEDRLQYYIARNNNSITQYEQQISNRRKDMADSTNNLKSNTQRAVRYLQLAVQNPTSNPKPLIPPIDINAPVATFTTSNSIFGNVSSAASNPFGQQSNPFGGGASSQSGSAFKPATVGGGAFGSQSLNSSPFATLKTTSNANGINSNTFGKTSSTLGQTGFGSTPAGGFGSSGFESTAISNPFGASPFSSSSPNTANPFGASVSPANTSTSAPTASAFGSSSFGQSGLGNSGFGQSSFATSTSTAPVASASGPSNIANPFGAGVPSGSSNPFGNSPSISNNSPFGNANPMNTNGGMLSSNNVFQGNSQASPFGEMSANKFGGQGSAGFKQSDLGEEHTKMEDINSEEILEIFRSDIFQIGRVPDIPPPVELC